MKGPISSQQGVALIVAILVIAIVTAISVSIISSNYLTTKRIYRQISNEQGQSYLRAVENLALKVLKQDMENDYAESKLFDGCNDIWAVPFENATYNQEGIYGGFINDLSGRLNLNNLASPPPQTPGAPANFPTIEQRRFASMLLSFADQDESLRLDKDQALRVTAAIADWIDADNLVTANRGAEGDYYQSLGIDAKPPNSPMFSVSELIIVLQILDDPALAAALYEALVPHVTVWPATSASTTSTTASAINLNTASDNVLRGLNVVVTDPVPAAINLQNYERLITSLTFPYQNEAQARADLNAGIKKAIGLNTNSQPIVQTSLGVQSKYFELTSYVTLGDLSMRMYTILQREYDPATQQASVHVLARSRNGISVECVR